MAVHRDSENERAGHMQRYKGWLTLGIFLVFGLAACVEQAEAQPGGRGGPGGSRGGFGGFGGGFGGRGGGRGGTLGMLADESVQKHLQITEEQKQKLQEMGERARTPSPEMQELFTRSREATEEEREVIRAEMEKLRDVQRAKTEAELKQVVSEQQFARIQQLNLQTRGVSALREDDVANDVKLSAQQRDQIEILIESTDEKRKAVFEGMRDMPRDMPREERMAAFAKMRERGEQMQKERDEQILAILTPEQKSAWQAKLGPELPKDDYEADPRPAPFGTGSRTAQSETMPATQVKPPIDSSSTMVAPDGTEVPQEVIAKFLVDDADEGKRPEKLSFNFRYAPWTDVLMLFADAAGLTLDLNDVPPGTFNYYDRGEYTPTEALNILNGYLLQKGFIMVRRDQFLYVTNLDNPIPPNLIPDVPVEQLSEHADNELVRSRIPLAVDDLDRAADEIKALLGPQGDVVPLATTKSLMVTGLVRNLSRVFELLKNVDPTGDETFRAFALKHIAAMDAETIVRELFGMGPRGVQNVSAAAGGDARSTSRFQSPFSRGGDPRFGGRGSDPRSAGRGGSPDQSTSRSTSTASSSGPVQVTSDDRTNSLLVKGSPANMKIVEEAIKAIDVSSDELDGTRVVQRPGEPYLEVYQLTSADAQEVSKTLTVMFPGSVINEDGRARRLHIHGTPELHEEISAVIRRLDGQGGGVQVAAVPLGRLDAYTATSTLQSLFLADGTSAPTILPDPTGRGLLVKGTSEQVTQIKLVLTQMDPSAGGGAGQGGRVRSIPLGGRDPMELMEMLQKIWGATNSNPIRVVIPSDSNPIRDRRVPSFVPEQRFDEMERSDEIDRRPDEPRTESKDVPSRPTRHRPPARSNQERRTTASASPLTAGGNRLRVTPAGLFSVADSPQTNGASAETPAAEKPAAEKPATEKPVAEKPAAEKPAAEKPAAEKPAAEKPAAEKPAAEKPAAEKPAAEEPAKESAVTAEEEPAAPDDSEAKPARRSTSPILLSPNGGNLVIMSDDEEALDRLEDLIHQMSQAVPVRQQWTVFYLRSADATEAATMLESLFPSSSVSTAPSSSSSGLFGGFSRGFSSMGRSLADMTGLSLENDPMTLRIIPEVRSNALFVTGPADQIRQVEDMLKILDASELPEQLRDRSPQFIPVDFADVSEVAEIVRNVYKEELEGENNQNNGGNPLAMLMGGGGSRGSSRGGRGGQRTVKLTLGVDTNTSQLIVSCSDSLYRQIENLVIELDRAAYEAKRTVTVVTVESTNPVSVEQALTSLLPNKINVSGSRKSGSSTGTRPSGGAPPSAGGNPDQMRQFFEQRMRERMQQMTGGGRPGGGSTSRSSSGRPGGGFSRGSSGGRPSGGRGGPGGGRGGR